MDAYLAYLHTIRDDLPQHVWDFASDPTHHRLDGSRTLHDSWLESIEVIETGRGPRAATRDVQIVLRLLGPMHDLYHVLRYDGVSSYALEGCHLTRGHGDLLAHEVRLENDGGALVHELRFVDDSSLVIQCRDIVHATELIT